MKLLSVGIIALTLLSCYSKKNPEPSNIPPVQSDSSIRASLLKGHSAITFADSTIIFTSDIQDIVDKESKLLLVTGRISDIMKVDSNYMMIVQGRFKKREAVAHIIVNAEQLPAMKTQHKSKGFFLIKPSKLTSSNFLTMSVESDGDPDIPSTYMAYDLDEVFYTFKGNLVDYRFQ